MKNRTQTAIKILGELVSFKTLSGQSNLEIISYVEGHLRDEGIPAHLSYDETGKRANIHAYIGPSVDGGVVLNGHTDVVPAEGQAWSSDPFILREDQGRLFGRGAVDMKGFLACMLASIPAWKAKPLKVPIHISMCYDEEIGGFGAPVLVADMEQTPPRPAIAIVGEPTNMKIITGHKGGFEMRTTVSGFEAHASDPRKGVSAISTAVKFISYLDKVAANLAQNAHADSAFDPPYTTINTGTIHGGTARNIIAGTCVFDWELRPIPEDNGDALIEKIQAYAELELLPAMQEVYPNAKIETEMQARVPALDQTTAQAASTLLREITNLNSTNVVAFATDAGHFCNAGISTAVFGPGSIEQAHKPDEFIEISEIEACLGLLDQLGDRLCQ